MSTLAPLGQRLAALQEQVSVLERDRASQFGRLGSSSAPPRPRTGTC